MQIRRLSIAGRWMRAHRWRTLASGLLAAFALINVWAYRHAWAMTHFAPAGAPTPRPEELSRFDRARVLLTGVNLRRPSNTQTPADLRLEYATHRVKTSSGIELEAWYMPHPSPRAVAVMFHGYGGCKANLLHEAREVHDLGCAALLVDFRGSGGSTGDVTTLGVYESSDVTEACRLARTIVPDRPLVLFGRSMGSVAILRAIARDGLAPSAIIVECPFDRLLSTVENRFTAMGLPAFPCAELLVFWGGVQHGMNGFAHNPVEYAARVRCPVLLMHGDGDRRVSLPEVQNVFAALRGEKRFEVFRGTGHESYFAAQPDLWRQRVADFVGAHFPAQRSRAGAQHSAGAP